MATETFAISMHMVPIMQAQKVQAYWPQPCKSTPILLGKWYPPPSQLRNMWDLREEEPTGLEAAMCQALCWALKNIFSLLSHEHCAKLL